MKIGKIINDFIEGLLVEKPEEVKTLKRIIALAVFWDKVVKEQEIQVAIELLEEKLNEMGLSGKAIDLIIDDFKELVHSYENDYSSFLEDRKWFFVALKNEEIDEKYLLFFECVFKSDGEISDSEAVMLQKIKTIKRKHDGN